MPPFGHAQTDGQVENIVHTSACRMDDGDITRTNKAVIDRRLRLRCCHLESYFMHTSGQAGVENGAMLTTYLFRYTSECTFS